MGQFEQLDQLLETQDGMLRTCAQRDRKRCVAQFKNRCARTVAVIFFASVEIGICTSGAHGFLRVRGRGGITTPGVLRMLLKLPAPACQSD